MNKILKILSILVIGFVMFSCSTPTNDPTLYVPEPSGPETPVETPTDDPVEETPETPTDNPVEETPEVQTYSIIFTPKDSQDPILQIFADYLNTLPEFKNLEEGTEVALLKYLYANRDASEITKEINENSVFKFIAKYDNNSEIDSVVIGNEDVEVEVSEENFIQFKD
ncbi:hypothetical protein [Treponema sp.]|uniref:hypothetical protein n=1 Tax=Treponema sp. TaxID=166 RepID=UPI00388D48DF